MTSQPLANCRVAITRPSNQSATLARLATEAGAEVLLLPLIDITGPADPAKLDAVLAGLSDFDLIVFVSPTAIEYSLPRILAGSGWPAHLVAAVVGPGSERLLAGHGIQALAPSEGADSESLLARPELADLTGRRVLIVRGNGGRPLLGDTLRERGADVQYVEAYRRRVPALDLSGLLADGALPVFVVTSSEALDNLRQLAFESLWQRLQSAVIVVSHPRVAEHATVLGFSRVVLTRAGDAGILEGMCQACSLLKT